MNPNSPHYQFDPTSLGWLHRRHREGLEITASDLGRLIEADPRNASDPIAVQYLVAICYGRLKQKRGRKALTPAAMWRVQAAEVLVKDRAEEIKAENKRAGRKHVPGDLEPCVQAADEIGRLLKLPTGRSLLNAISARKNSFLR